MDGDALLLRRIGERTRVAVPGFSLLRPDVWGPCQGPCWTWTGYLVPARPGRAARPVIEVKGRRRLVRRELRRMLVHGGVLPGNCLVVQDGRCTDPRCVSVWHSGDKVISPPWNEDLHLLDDLVQILNQARFDAPFVREDFAAFTDHQLASAAKAAPEIRKWMRSKPTTP